MIFWKEVATRFRFPWRTKRNESWLIKSLLILKFKIFSSFEVTTIQGRSEVQKNGVLPSWISIIKLAPKRIVLYVALAKIGGATGPPYPLDLPPLTILFFFFFRAKEVVWYISLHNWRIQRNGMGLWLLDGKIIKVTFLHKVLKWSYVWSYWYQMVYAVISGNFDMARYFVNQVQSSIIFDLIWIK